LQYKWKARRTKRNHAVSPGAYQPVGREELNSFAFPEVQHGMSVLIQDIMALLCVA
jgi:hypothetical protein